MLDLELIKARYEAIEPGPWEAPLVDTGDAFFDEGYEIYPPLGEAGPVALVPSKGLAAFVAAARMDVPALVAEVERLRAAISSFGHLAKAARALYCFASALEKGWSCEALNHVFYRGWQPENLRELASDIQEFLSELRSEAE